MNDEIYYHSICTVNDLLDICFENVYLPIYFKIELVFFWKFNFYTKDNSP